MAGKLSISFYGGARVVTGSCFLVECEGTKILVDCGLIQGGRFCESDNLKPFPFDPAGIDAVFVTHAHTDHIGRIPKLVKNGFRGHIYSTAPTKELAALMLEDSLPLLERDAASCGEPAPYGARDLIQTLGQWWSTGYHTTVTVGAITVSFMRAGHILGSSMLDMNLGGRRLVFSGDLGAVESLLMPPSEDIQDVDYLVTEATYGNVEHPPIENGEILLERSIEDVAARRGTLMIPAFATERTQDILFLLNKMVVEKRVPEIPIFVDSPLAIKVTEIFEKYHDYFNDDVKALYLKHPHLFQFKGLRNTPTTDESRSINNVPPPKVIIAGSGMMTGGRILHHLKRYLPDASSTLLIVGYQGSGSIGRKLLDGADSVEIFGETVPVRAKISVVQAFSAHADKNRLYNFVSDLRRSLKHVFAVHAEPEAADAFIQIIRDRLGIQADAPKIGDRYELE